MHTVYRAASSVKDNIWFAHYIATNVSVRVYVSFRVRVLVRTWVRVWIRACRNIVHEQLTSGIVVL